MLFLQDEPCVAACVKVGDGLPGLSLQPEADLCLEAELDKLMGILASQRE